MQNGRGKLQKQKKDYKLQSCFVKQNLSSLYIENVEKWNVVSLRNNTVHILTVFIFRKIVYIIFSYVDKIYAILTLEYYFLWRNFQYLRDSSPWLSNIIRMLIKIKISNNIYTFEQVC